MYPPVCLQPAQPASKFKVIQGWTKYYRLCCLWEVSSTESVCGSQAPSQCFSFSLGLEEKTVLSKKEKMKLRKERWLQSKYSCETRRYRGRHRAWGLCRWVGVLGSARGGWILRNLPICSPAHGLKVPGIVSQCLAQRLSHCHKPTLCNVSDYIKPVFIQMRHCAHVGLVCPSVFWSCGTDMMSCIALGLVGQPGAEPCAATSSSQGSVVKAAGAPALPSVREGSGCCWVCYCSFPRATGQWTHLPDSLAFLEAMKYELNKTSPWQKCFCFLWEVSVFLHWISQHSKRGFFLPPGAVLGTGFSLNTFLPNRVAGRRCLGLRDVAFCRTICSLLLSSSPSTCDFTSCSEGVSGSSHIKSW